MGKRLKDINIENTEENRRTYRELLFTCQDVINNYISGVIMFEETLSQKTYCGEPFIEILQKKNIIPGIKVDLGVVDVSYGAETESVTAGLDGLGKRCAKYKEAGCHFAKWRSIIKITDELPTPQCILETAYTLSRYARICQENGLVPIVEPEVLPDGKHDIERCQSVTEVVLSAVYQALSHSLVYLEGTLLKPNMVTCGMQAEKKDSPEKIATYTVEALSRTVPPAVAGVVFLSGGQSEEEAIVNLNEINKVNNRKPWPLSFSYGRALQASVIKTWAGNSKNIDEAHSVLISRAKANSDASLGKYEPGSLKSVATGSLYVEKNIY